jgi:hypothetical protein
MITPTRFTARALALGTIAALTLATFAPAPVMAGTPSSRPASASPASGDRGITDISARRRQQARHYRNNGGAAAAAAFAGIIGTIGTIAAAQSRRDYYDSGYGYYGGGPRYYGYGGGYPYGRRDYYGRSGYYGY